MTLPLPQKVNPQHTALVVIDIQKDFASPEGVLGKKGRNLSMVEPLLDKLEATVAVAEKAGVPVFYFRQVYDRTKLTSLQLNQYDADGRVPTCDVATDGWGFYRINPPADKVFTKYTFNIFSNADFAKTLEDKGITTLVITGMDTIFCVEVAIRTAFDLGYMVVLPTDLVAGNANHRDLHDRTLYLTGKYFGVLTDADELKSIWEK